MKTVKSIFSSKTVWLNLIMGLVAVATFIDPELLSAIGIDDLNQPKVLKIVGAVTAILNILLRMATNTPVVFKKEADAPTVK